jgi:hypothetical protein
MLASDGTATVEYVPNCSINAFEFKTAVKAQAKLFEMINGDPTEVFASQTLNADDPPYTITPTQTFKVWFSSSDEAKSQELVLDFTNQLSQIVSYSESGWTLVGPSAYTVGACAISSAITYAVILNLSARRHLRYFHHRSGLYCDAGSKESDASDASCGRGRRVWLFLGPSALSRFAYPLTRYPTHITNKTRNQVEGYVDTDKLKIRVMVYVLGVNLGQFYGNLTEGLVIKLKMFIIQGEIKFYFQDSAKAMMFGSKSI